MRRFGMIVLGLALILGSLALFGYRQMLTSGSPVFGPSGPSATRSVETSGAPPAASRSPARTEKLSGLQIFEIALNVANVLVGLFGILLTFRGMRAVPPPGRVRSDA